MNSIRTRRSFSPILALVLALILSALPAALFAQGAGDAIVYQSDVLPAASSPGRQITLTLSGDGSATMSTDFLNDEDPIVELGEWSLDEAGKALSLTLTGRADADYETPVEIGFAVDGDTIEATDYDATLYGSEGLTLTLVDATAAQAKAADEALVGVYVSESLPAASSPGRIITLTLAGDGSATMSTDYQNDEDPIVEMGTWSHDADAGEVALTLSGRADTDYEVPVEIVFAVQEDGSLVATEYDLSLFGSEGLTLAPADSPVQSVDGVYISDVLPAADTPGQVVFMILYPDNNVQASTYYLNNEPPIQEVGTWEDNQDGSVTVVVTGTIENEYDVPQELVFERDGDTLTYLSLTLTRLADAALSQGPEPVAWYQTDVMPAASSSGLQLNLILYDDNSVQMVSDSMNDEEPIIEVGDWVDNDDATLTVTLTGRPDQEYPRPDVITFERSDDGTLTAIEYDESIYGSLGLVFAEQPLDDLSLSTEPEGAGAVQGGNIQAGEAITLTATPTVSLPAATTPAATPAATPEIPSFEVPTGATAVYVSDVLPAASSPGRVVRLVLFSDGSLQMVTDYLNGESPVLELGTYTDNGDGTLSVELVGQIDGLYETPVAFTFEQTETGLVATEWDQTLYGSEGLELATEFQAE